MNGRLCLSRSESIFVSEPFYGFTAANELFRTHSPALLNSTGVADSSSSPCFNFRGRP